MLGAIHDAPLSRSNYESVNVVGLAEIKQILSAPNGQHSEEVDLDSDTRDLRISGYDTQG
jgi:hypothetical protein